MVGIRSELLQAGDATIEDAVQHANPMALRGLLYQLTGDEGIAATRVEMTMFRGREVPVLADPADASFLRARAAEFLKAYRDAGAGDLPIGQKERLPRSLGLAVGEELPPLELDLWLEEFALDPWARSLEWHEPPPAEVLGQFSVAVIGTGMGGLNAAIQLQYAGIPFVVLEKNAGVGGTWFENRYPGCRVDTPSLSYTNLFGLDYEFPYAFCPQSVNEQYFNWVADHFAIRKSIEFNTEVKSVVWDEEAKLWEITAEQPGGARVWKANAVVTAVGFLSHPNIPDFPGMADFTGQAFHTARWPSDVDVRGKRVAVIGSGCSGYQVVPELVKETEHLYLFQRTPSWVFDIDGYLDPFPPQVLWLQRNFPYLANFGRFNAGWEGRPQQIERSFSVDPDYQDDPHAVSAYNKIVRDQRIEFMQSKFADRPDLMEKMLPVAPPNSSRPVLMDRKYGIYDALLRDDVTLVSEGIRGITGEGIEGEDGTKYGVDIIVLATGFRADDFLLPIEIRGRGGLTAEELWAKDGPRAYLGTMLPGFPNLFMIYGPNTNPIGGLGVPPHQEIITRFALECMAALIECDNQSVDVTMDAYWRYNEALDREEARKIYRDARVHTYWNKGGRSATNGPFDIRLLWHWLRNPGGNPPPIGEALAEKSTAISPRFGEDLVLA